MGTVARGACMGCMAMGPAAGVGVVEVGVGREEEAGKRMGLRGSRRRFGASRACC